MMTERDWELYRLRVVEQQPESPHKESVIAGIKHKLRLLDQSRSLLKKTKRKRQTALSTSVRRGGSASY
jgi:hypothetical protein